jgi:hypothetical protein
MVKQQTSSSLPPKKGLTEARKLSLKAIHHKACIQTKWNLLLKN